MRGVPRESSDQAALVARIRRAGWLVIHVPNQGKRSVEQASALKRMGVLSGVPDLLVFGRPYGAEQFGVAVELRRRGVKRTVSAGREVVYGQFARAGWLVLREQDGEQATAELTRLGYLPAFELPGWQGA